MPHHLLGNQFPQSRYGNLPFWEVESTTTCGGKKCPEAAATHDTATAMGWSKYMTFKWHIPVSNKAPKMRKITSKPVKYRGNHKLHWGWCTQNATNKWFGGKLDMDSMEEPEFEWGKTD